MKETLNRKKFLILIGLAITCCGKSELEERVETAQMAKSPNKQYPPVQIPDTEVRPLTSKAVQGMEYQIYIALPEGYDSSSETYPVLYFLDAWAQFGILKQAYWVLRFYNEVPPLLLVGIAFEGDAQDLLYYRARDYTPTKVPPEKLSPGIARFTPVSGGAPNFLRFLEEELFPMIETEYRADKSGRAIFGVSYGGLFATYVLFNRPELFQRYLLGSPSWWWDDEVVFKHEENYAKTYKSLHAKVFMTTGSEEGNRSIERWAQLRDRLKSRDYEGFELTSMIFEGETHMSVIPATHSRALRVLYSD